MTGPWREAPVEPPSPPCSSLDEGGFFPNDVEDGGTADIVVTGKGADGFAFLILRYDLFTLGGGCLRCTA